MLFLEILKVILKPFINFLKFWYIEIPWHLWDRYSNRIAFLERSFGVKINIENLFVPLWQDYSLLGRVLSFPIRIFKIFIGFLVYFLLTLIIFLFFILIEILPFFLIFISF